MTVEILPGLIQYDLLFALRAGQNFEQFRFDHA